MIYGIGVDLQTISQLEQVMKRQGENFLRKVFTDRERAYCSRYACPAKHLAARWAVKEAFMKAMGSGLGGKYMFKDLEVVNRSSGQPELVLRGNAEEDRIRLGLHVYISISHSGEYALGQVVLCKA
ncbi:holo-ACP synthase [Paenibacillus sp. GbtcB18]|uniref:holo-ACP synthase n=1 Tax=Paenibacillus sp. GbtcB18 TaxID=2824763 RepID=UPI001C3116EB|nr:holo-ACP synthase [Paenibacillus sp. GbtcB18]